MRLPVTQNIFLANVLALTYLVFPELSWNDLISCLSIFVLTHDTQKILNFHSNFGRYSPKALKIHAPVTFTSKKNP